MKLIIAIALLWPLFAHAEDSPTAAEQAALEARIEQLEREQQNAESLRDHLDAMRQIKGYVDPADAGVW